MTSDQEIDRGRGMARIVNDPLYQEAWNVPKERIIGLLESADLDPEKRARLNALLVAFAQARRYAEQVMQTGKMAAQQIERDRTFTERVKERVGI